jgi:hypothetical protein
MFAIASLSFFVSLFIWILIIRPYCVRHRKGYTPGAHPSVTIWVDWQEAAGLAKERDDKGMIFVCRLFLMLQMTILAVIMVAMFRG